jgi:TPR repeat protein
MNTVLVILFAISMLLLLTWYRQTQAEHIVNAQRQSYEANSSSEAGSTLSRPEQQFASSNAQKDATSEGANFAPKPVVTASTPQVGTEAEIKSIEWAAQHGNADAQYQLANLLAQGRGVPQDLVSAYAWYVIADAAGNPNSKDAMKQLTAKLPPDGIASVRSKLGQMYATGFGVPKDYTKAYTWFSLAEAAGDQQSEHEKMLLAQKMTEQEIAEGSNRASDWLKKH